MFPRFNPKRGSQTRDTTSYTLSRRKRLAYYILCVWVCVQFISVCLVAVRHGLTSSSLRADMETLEKRAQVLVREQCFSRDSPSEVDGNLQTDLTRRDSADIRQLATQLEAILARHCANTSGLCLPGLKGDPGKTGSKGRPGGQGIQGAPGLKGNVAAPGSAGPRGMPGAQGLPGQRGMPGLKGERGAKGGAGSKGTRGEKGVTGSPGTRGLTGPKGGTGERGTAGIAGERGTLGPSGQKGEKGRTGARGQAGPEGLKGQPDARNSSCLCKLPSLPQQPRVISACDFERGSCDWRRPGTSYGWRRAGFPRQSDFTGPRTDHSVPASSRGHYMFTNAFFGLSEMTSDLTSQWLTGGGDYYLELWYYLSGARAGSLAVDTESKSHVRNHLWLVAGDQGDHWQKARVTVTSNDDFRFVLVARFGGHFTADVFVDDITVFSGACS